MHILLVHNFYQSKIPSGENAVVEGNIQILRSAGHQVHLFSRTNDEIQQNPLSVAAEAAFLSAWNYFESNRFRRELQRLKPDVVHVHNSFPLISPAALVQASRMSVPLVWTVHNYRPWCIAGNLFRDEAICTLCPDTGSVLPGWKHACYRGSRVLSTIPSFSTLLHQARGTWCLPERIIVLTQFQRVQLARWGLPEHRMTVCPHFVTDCGYLPWLERDPTIAYVGRMAQEKGVQTLIRAFAELPSPRPKLLMIGDGVMRRKLEEHAQDLGVSHEIDFRGNLAPNVVRKELSRCQLLIVPSEWHETFGLSIIEALSHAVPVLVSKVAALPDLIGNGKAGGIFEPGNPIDLAQQIQKLFLGNTLMVKAQNARQRYELQHSPASAIRRLEKIYSEAICLSVHSKTSNFK